MTIFAHSLPEQTDQLRWEPLRHHLSGVGRLASIFAEPFGASAAALAMGLLHDIGKCSDAYQAYIRRPADMGGPKGPDHSSAGAREAVAAYGPLGRLLSYGIAGHHSGLMDGDGHEGSTLKSRLTKMVEYYAGWRDHVAGLPEATDLAKNLTPPAPNPIAPGFEMAFFARMLFSCLVDADFLETERFYALADGRAAPARGGTIGQHHLDAIRRHMARHRREDSPVNILRSQILDHANGKAALTPGLFTLTVPTGGGKTLTSLSFALEHALAHDLRRIIYVIPFTSIIEQTAEVFRTALAMPDDILEHHGGVDRNASSTAAMKLADGRLPRGGVDRNFDPLGQISWPAVASRNALAIYSFHLMETC